jgi:hypothetical protein
MAERAEDAPLLTDLDDFVAWLAGRTGRYEFLDGRIVAVAGGSELTLAELYDGLDEMVPAAAAAH